MCKQCYADSIGNTNACRRDFSTQQQSELRISEDEINQFEQHLITSRPKLVEGSPLEVSPDLNAPDPPVTVSDITATSTIRHEPIEPPEDEVESELGEDSQEALPQSFTIPTDGSLPKVNLGSRLQCAITPSGASHVKPPPPQPKLSTQEKKQQRQIVEQSAWVDALKSRNATPAKHPPPRPSNVSKSLPARKSGNGHLPRQTTNALPGWGNPDALAVSMRISYSRRAHR